MKVLLLMGRMLNRFKAINSKYLGLTIDDSLDWHIQTSNVISKINQRMIFIRKLNAFRIDKYLISLFYRSVIESVVSFCLYVYGGNALCKDIMKIYMILKHGLE